MKKGSRQSISPDQWLGSILEALYIFHSKMDSPPMPFSIARTATFRNGRAICMYYSELEDDHLSSFIRKIDDINMKISRVAQFFFEENDQREKYDVCRCISTSATFKEATLEDSDAAAKEVPDVSIAYFTNSEDLCQYLKSSTFSGVVQHVSADCGPDLCETRYRMLKTTWYRQTISTEMKKNIHRVSANIPVHEKFCTFDGPMHLVEAYPTCSKSLNAKISSFIKTIKNAVNAYIPVSAQIWNGEFYLNHSRVGILRFEFTSFVQIVSKQHFSSLHTADRLIAKTAPISINTSSRPQTGSSALKNLATSTSVKMPEFGATRPQSASAIFTPFKPNRPSLEVLSLATCVSKFTSNSSPNAFSPLSSLKMAATSQEGLKNAALMSNFDSTLDEPESPTGPSSKQSTFAKYKEAQRRVSLTSKVVRRLSMLKTCDLFLDPVKAPPNADQLFKVKVKNVKTIAPTQRIDCPQCGTNAEFQRCDLIPLDIVLNSLQVRAKIYAIENPNLHINEGYMPLWEIDPFIGSLYSCVALFEQTIADVIQTSAHGTRAQTISLSEWLAFSRKSKMYEKIPITKEEIVQIFEDANRCDFLSDDNQFEMTIEEFCQALIFVAQKTGYLHHIDRLNAPLSWKLLPDGDVVRCVRNMLDHLDIRDNPDFPLGTFPVADGPTSYILQKLKQRDLSKKKWLPTNEIPLLEKIRRDNFLSKIAEIREMVSKSDGRQSSAFSARAQLKSNDVVSKFSDMLVSLFYVHYSTPFEAGTKEARAVETLLNCKEFMTCRMRVCESCILAMLGVFISDSKTGMSLQQQAEQSPNSRSPSRSPPVATPRFPSKSPSPTKSGVSCVPRLNLSPNSLRKRIVQINQMSQLGVLSHEVSEDGMPYTMELAAPISSACDLKARRERLLASLLDNEQDSHCARDEYAIN